MLDADEDHVEANRIMGYILLDEGRAQQATEHFERALAVDPEDGKTIRMLGRALQDLGKDEEAIDAFRRAIEIDETDAWAHFDYGKKFHIDWPEPDRPQIKI